MPEEDMSADEQVEAAVKAAVKAIQGPDGPDQATSVMVQFVRDMVGAGDAGIRALAVYLEDLQLVTLLQHMKVPSALWPGGLSLAFMLAMQIVGARMDAPLDQEFGTDTADLSTMLSGAVQLDND